MDSAQWERMEARVTNRPYLAKSNVSCRSTEQMVENHMIKITEGWMVNTLQQLAYPGAEQKEEARAGGGAFKVTDSKVLTVPHTLDLRIHCLHRTGCGLASLRLSLCLGQKSLILLSG